MTTPNRTLLTQRELDSFLNSAATLRTAAASINHEIVLKNHTLNGLKLPGSLIAGIMFENCDFTGVTVTTATYSNGTSFRACEFHGCILPAEISKIIHQSGGNKVSVKMRPSQEESKKNEMRMWEILRDGTQHQINQREKDKKNNPPQPPSNQQGGR